ncbi:MAG: FctA domain-containing protein, partial [Atopobiaceae bacterium]|nr:FctA domain-containing protein [Atopobiaceae bacterium]
MFSGCSGLTSLDLSGLDTSSVTGMTSMFSGCSGLTSLDLSGLDTSKVEEMGNMFYDCSGLTSLNLSGLDTASVTYMSYMFDGCSSLSKITLGAKFKWIGTWGYLPLYVNHETPNAGWIRIDDASGLPAEGAVELSSAKLGEQYPRCGVGTYVRNTFIDVHFDGNGAIGSMSDQKINGHVDSKLNPVGNSFSHSGYIFTGWNTEQEGSGLAFADGATIEADVLRDYFADHEITLYAQWEDATDVTVSEGVLEITMPADYVAHIEGLPAGTSYRVYEQTPEGWTLVESTGTTGVIKPNENQEAAFVNEHTPDEKSVTAQIFATKTLDGALATADSGFHFTLSAAEGSPDYDTFKVQTKTVSDGGNVGFDPITYTMAGTYAYVISEDTGDPNIAYDTNVELVTVNVTEGDDGGLTATVAYDDSDGDPGVARFDNTTKPGSLSITKKAVGNGGDLTETAKNVEFTFLLTVNGGAYAGGYTVGGETRSTDDGTIHLKASETATVDGLKKGDAYAVTEVEVPAGWTAGKAPDNATGTIAANQVVALEFTNTYAASGQAQLVAYKELPGASLAAGQYEFALYKGADPAEDAEPLETVSNGAADGTEFLPDEETGEPTTIPNPIYGMAPAYFSPLEYTLADVGEHVYTIREVMPSEGDRVPGIAYDESVWTATVMVTDNGDGTLSTVVTYAKEGEEAEHAIFTNALQPTELRVEKRVKDQGSLSEAAAKNLTFEFAISLKNDSGESLGQEISGTVYDAATDEPVKPEVTVTVSDGEPCSLEAGQYVLFEDVPYGTVYEVTEAERPGWTQVPGETTGTSGTTTSDEVASAVFVNAYSASGEATLEAAKTIDGKLPEDGEFAFLLYDVTGLEEGAEPDLAHPLQRVSNDAEGMVRFAPIEYTAADNQKTYTYQIRELQGTEENVSYDETVVTAEVAVRDNGNGTMEATVTYLVDGKEIPEGWYTFQNWVMVTLARTGGPGVWAAGVGTMMLAAGCALWLRRRRGGLR